MGCAGIMLRRYLCCVDLDAVLSRTCVSLQSVLPQCHRIPFPPISCRRSSVVYVSQISYRLHVVNIAFIHMFDLVSFRCPSRSRSIPTYANFYVKYRATRMSIVFSLMRMVPPSGRMRTVTSGFSVFLYLLWALCAASKAYICGSDTSWYNLPDIQCPIGLPTAVVEFTSDFYSSQTLVAWIDESLDSRCCF